MVEDESLCRRRPYHQQKLALILASMRDHAAGLRGAGLNVHYYPLDQQQTIIQALVQLVARYQPSTLKTFEVSDVHLTRRLRNFCTQHALTWETVGDPGFLTSSTAFAQHLRGRKSMRMADFYRHQRQRLGLLVDDELAPTGGQWSFDADNRHKVTANQSIPNIKPIIHSPNARQVIREVAAAFPQHPGRADQLWLPTTRKAALAWLNVFLRERLVGFGTYEDAISTRSSTLFHSTLSPVLNIGLITPDEVVAHTLRHAQSTAVPINDLEGFLRQIIGWREFMRGVYQHFGASMRHSNTRGQTRLLTPHWYNGNTGIAPLDLAISTQQRLGWNHHIDRLMVIANLMNLCEIAPKATFEYFMTNYVDAYDWVMVPNVFGMGLNSDGGVFATKPYICGSNYLLKMSDIKRGEWCDPVDGLYWRFIEKHRAELEKNPRLSMFVSGVDRLQPDRKQRIFAAADAFLTRCTRPGPENECSGASVSFIANNNRGPSE
ncbi:MAG: deoxyribodipyrimidine photolyase-related protein [Gammaproteobacteria bacterium]|jgi:deoxyribodipyrimidine photolyase-related protein